MAFAPSYVFSLVYFCVLGTPYAFMTFLLLIKKEKKKLSYGVVSIFQSIVFVPMYINGL